MLTVWNPLNARSNNLLNLLDDFFAKDVDALSNVATMKVDVVEREKDFLIHADLPGVAKEDISVSYEKGILTIAAQSKQEQKSGEGEKVWRLERSFAKKSRSFNFEDRIDENGIVAQYENGVLSLTLPKRETPVSFKQIEVK